jgi:hypothetical protein
MLVQIHPDEAKLLQEINWEMVRELKQLAGDSSTSGAPSLARYTKSPTSILGIFMAVTENRDYKAEIRIKLHKKALDRRLKWVSFSKETTIMMIVALWKLAVIARNP